MNDATGVLDSPVAAWAEIDDDDARFEAFISWVVEAECRADAEARDARERAELTQLNDQQVLDRLLASQRALAREQARHFRLIAEAERRGATESVERLGTASWLVLTNSHSPRAARRLVREAEQLAQHPHVLDALHRADLSVEQATALADGLSRLPDELSVAEVDQVRATLLAMAGEFGPDALRRLVNRAIGVVAPEVADEADRRCVERSERRQHAGRSLTWWSDADGSVEVRATLPAVPGQQLVTLIKALATKQHAVDCLTGAEATWQQACADALATVIEHYAASGRAPGYGHDRPRVVVCLDYATLAEGVGSATLLGVDQPMSPSQARRLACDARILPVVLGGDSVPLDVGRERRLITGSLRQALAVRDRGCAFPGCDRQPGDCDAHHIQPWWSGGATSLANTVLLCPRHHHLVEPNPRAPGGSRWEVRLDSRELPEVISPTRRDGTRRTRQHHRFRLRG